MKHAQDLFIIEGGAPLAGSLPTFRAKNSALYLMLASILTDEPVVLRDVPRLSDVLINEEILRHVGVETEWRGHDLHLRAANLNGHHAHYSLVNKMRASFVIMGALLARTGEARVSMPGGCAFGPRPVDRHLAAFEALGATISDDSGDFYARRTAPLAGTVHFEEPTVGGTQNVLLATALGAGEVVIENAAREPEVADLANMLNAMGADVSGAGSSTIVVKGVPALHGVTYRPIADRIEAGTYLLAAAATRGAITMTDLEPENLGAVLEALEATGVKVTTGADWVAVDATGPLKPTEIVAEVYPGVPTDLQAPFGAYLATIPGLSLVRDEVYPDRFTHVPELVRAGARMELTDNEVEIRGGQLQGGAMHAADIRAGGALVIAALAAEGASEIGGLAYVDRGYADFAQRLQLLGGHVERKGAAAPPSPPDHAGQVPVPVLKSLD